MIIAITACIVTYIGDVLMLAQPMSGSEYFSIYKNTMVSVSHQRLLWGNTLGLAVMFQLFGYFVVYLMIKRENLLLANMFFYSLCFSMLAGLAYHCSFAFYGTGLQVHKAVNSSITSSMIAQFEEYHIILYRFMGLFFGLGSLAFAVLIFWKDTLFKKWHFLFNPLFILIVVRLLLKLIPSPAGGYLAPGYGNITAVIFFLFAISVLHKNKWQVE